MGLISKNKLDFYSEFKDWYLKIVNEFGFNIKRDRKARDYLSNILSKKTNNYSVESVLTSFSKMIKSKSIILIYGCGPSLEESVDFLFNNHLECLINKSINLVADGASILLKEKNIPIGGIFTDLDGITKNELNYAEYIFVHAHGDNMEKLKYFTNNIINFNNVIGTTQVEPVYNILNPGGFTDGDRILFFLRSFLQSYHKIFLMGMDFKNIVGKYSKQNIKENKEASPIKRKKLNFAVQLLNWISNRIENQIYIVNSKVESEKFRYISLGEFKNQIAC